MPEETLKEFEVTLVVFISAISKEDAENIIHNQISKVDGTYHLEVQNVEATEIA